ncbi:MAG: hypothetical protein HY360_00110 [Verrucomicrobia bacterium]|nr:hypothetical protein [Verrucomicrobiota bacterium]
MESPQLLLPARSAHGSPFWQLAFSDGVILLTLILLIVVMLTQVVAMGTVFWSRTYFGSSFNPVLYSEFEARRSNAAVNNTLGLKEAEAARRAASAPVRDRVALTLERAVQEMDQARVRQSETDFVRQESEKKAESLMAQAEASWKIGALNRAADQLRGALALAPDYLPALQKMALLCEDQREVSQARFLWEKAAAIASPETPQMREIQQNLARLAGLYPDDKPAPETAAANNLSLDVPEKAPTQQEPNTLSLALVTRTNLPLQDLYDLRFNLRIALGSKGFEPYMDVSQTRVEITFYDQSNTAEGTLIPIKVYHYALQPKGKWATGTEQILSLNYSVPRGYFRKRAQKFGSSYTFCGFVLRASYCGQILDTHTQPAEVLAKYARMP